MIRDPRIFNRVSLIETVIFTSSTTYRVPANARLILVEGLGGGGGGGGGARVSSATFVGGGGGGGGAPCIQVMMVATPGSAITVTIGAGGAGGAGRLTSNGNGSNGSKGGSSRFDTFYFPGGRRGGAGTTTANGAGGPGYVDLVQGRAIYNTTKGYCGYGNSGGGGGGGGSYLGGAGGAGGFSADVAFDEPMYSGGKQSTNDLFVFSNDESWDVPDGQSGNGGNAAIGRDGGGTETNGATGGGGGGGSAGVGFNATSGGAGGNGEIRIWVFG